MKRALISAAIGTTAAVALSAAPAWASTGSSGTVNPGRAAYTVVPGDSFWAVGQRYDVNMYDLAAWNHMNLNAPLDVGWTLQIPPAGWHASSAAAPSTTSYSGYSGRPSYSTSDSPAASSASSYSPEGIWACIARFESGSNPSTDTGNGYYGMYQFTLGSWQAAGGSGNPADASAAEQTAVAERVQQQQGWGAWPVTSRECGA